MTKFYQVYQCHSPSGGISAVDETRYSTSAEASGVAEAMTGEVSEFVTFDVGGSKYQYPAYWAQGMREEKGTLFMELS